MKTYVYLIIFALSFVFINGQAQEDNKFHKRNSILIELGGTGGYYSLNYERFIFNQESFKTSAQLGYGYFPSFRDIWIPVGINQLYSFKNHHIELGIGFIAVREAVIEDNILDGRHWLDMISGRIGYRYQKPDGRLIYRISFTPILERERIRSDLYYPDAPFNAFVPWGGVSIGYSW